MGKSLKDTAVQCQDVSASTKSEKRSIDGENSNDEPAKKKIKLDAAIPYELSVPDPKQIVSQHDDHLPKSVDLETCIRLNYKYLKAELQPGEIADMLYEDGLLDEENIERISEAKERRLKCDILLKAIRRKGNDFPLKRLFHILKRTGFEYTIEKLETVTFEENCTCNVPNSSLVNFINDMKNDLLDEIEPLDFIDDILIRGGLSFVDHEDIMNMTHRHDRVKSIIDKARKSSGETRHSIICPIIKEHKEMFERFLVGNKESWTQKENFVAKGISSTGTGVTNFEKTSIGASLNVKFTFKTTNSGSEELKSIEKKIVESYKSQPSLQTKVKNLVMEDCISSLEKMSFSSVVLQIKTMSRNSSKKLIQACGKGHIAKWILDMLTDEDINTLKRLQVKALALEIHLVIQNEEIAPSCCCNLTKEFIKLNNTDLVNEMIGTRAIVKRFMQSGILSNDDVEELNHVIRDPNIQEQNGALLKFVLKPECPTVLLCIMEREILQHCKPGDRMLTLLSADTPEERLQGRLNHQDIMIHRKFLEEELDGRTFIKEVAIRNKQLENTLLGLRTRAERTNIFLEFLCNESENLEWFEQALKMKGMGYILDKIFLAKESKNRYDTYMSPITSNYQSLLHEIEPRRVVEFLEGTSLINKTELQQITQLPSRKERAARMLQDVLTNNCHRRVDTFLMALEYAGYNKLVEQIKTGCRNVDACTYACPLIAFLEKKSPENDSALIYKGTINIEVLKCSNVEDIDKRNHFIVPSCETCSDDSVSNISTFRWIPQEGNITSSLELNDCQENNTMTHQWIKRHFTDDEGSSSSGGLERSMEEHRGHSSTASHKTASLRYMDDDRGVGGSSQMVGLGTPPIVRLQQFQNSQLKHDSDSNA